MVCLVRLVPHIAVRCVFVFSLWSIAVPYGYFRDGCLDADGPTGGRADFLIAIGVVVCLGSGSGRFGSRDSVIGRFVRCIGGREVCSVFTWDVCSCEGEPRCSDLIL